MFGLISKIVIIVLATVMTTTMPSYFTEDVEGFVPTQETVNRNLHIESASVSSQISSFDFSGDISSEVLGSSDQSDSKQNNAEDKSQAYNTKSEKVLGEVADRAIENNNPIISCDDEEASCEEEVSFPTSPTPTVTPTPTISRPPTPTIVPVPTITIVPLPSKFPTMYPCPPRPVDSIAPEIEIPPCPDVYLH